MNLINEDKFTEYKTAKNALPKDFWETYSAFANTSGGTVILGVNDNLEISGVNDVVKIKKELFTSLNNPKKVNQKLITDNDIIEKTIDGKKLIEIHIPEAELKQKPIYMNENIKMAWIREYETDRKASNEEIKQMIRNSRDDLDSDLLDAYDIDDLDLESLEQYKQMLANRNERFQKIDYENMLIEIGAMKKDRKNGGQYKLTVGGLLFFGKYNSITSIPNLQGFHLDYLNYIGADDRWIDRISTGDIDNINVFNFYKKVLSRLIGTIKENFELNKDMNRKDNSERISIALREALANSLIHADYFSNEGIRIEAYPSYYSFFNPGKMKITIEEFFSGGKPYPRNHTITTLFRKVGISERAGSGGPEIYKSAEVSRFNLPDIFLENNSTTLKLWVVDIADAHPELNEHEKKILKYLINDSEEKTSSEIKKDTGITKYYFDKSIKNLVEKKIVNQTGRGKGTKYSLQIGTLEHITSLSKKYFNKKYK